MQGAVAERSAAEASTGRTPDAGSAAGVATDFGGEDAAIAAAGVATDFGGEDAATAAAGTASADGADAGGMRAGVAATGVADSRAVAADLLAWYDKSARVLPWRSPPGARADPYHVWLSEIMLQQTTVKAVIPFYRKFLERWPTVTGLAAADIDAVMAAWAGLGYYSRARNLHECAKSVAAVHGGRFPADEDRLLELPGIGAYTAAAIAAIAFDTQATAVDGNIERVVARLFAVEEPLPAAKPRIKALAARLSPLSRIGDYTQAMMDLGASICSPRSPSCLVCPLRRHCRGYASGIAEMLPIKAKKGQKPQRFGAAFLATRGDGAVLLRRRPPKGLLGGMLEVPSTGWGAAMPDGMEALAQAPFPVRWRLVPGSVRHSFTHFDLELTVYRARGVAFESQPLPGMWYARESLPAEALPSVMRKVLSHGLDDG